MSWPPQPQHLRQRAGPWVVESSLSSALWLRPRLLACWEFSFFTDNWILPSQRGVG